MVHSNIYIYITYTYKYIHIMLLEIFIHIYIYLIISIFIMYAIYLFISLYIYPVRSLCIFDTARYRCSQDMKDKHSKVALFGSKAPLENRCRPVGGWGGWIPLMSFLVEIYRIRSKHMIKYQQKESLKKERPILQFIDFILTQQ